MTARWLLRMVEVRDHRNDRRVGDAIGLRTDNLYGRHAAQSDGCNLGGHIRR